MVQKLCITSYFDLFYSIILDKLWDAKKYYLKLELSYQILYDKYTVKAVEKVKDLK